MGLPIRTTIDDIRAVCTYLSKKPTGATIVDARRVLDSKVLDGRKLTALKFWGLIEEHEERLKVTSDGRSASRESELPSVMIRVVRRTGPYNAIIERAAHRGDASTTATDVAAHWHQHYPDDVADTDKILNDQAVCFFQIATSAGLGSYVVGRNGASTRFEFNEDALQGFIDGIDPPSDDEETPEPADRAKVVAPPKRLDPAAAVDPALETKQLGQGIFVGHGKNKKALEQLKKLLDQFKIPYKVAVEEPNLGRPIGEKVKEVMQSCNCAILVFTADEEFRTVAGETIWRSSENVVHELGASGYLYGKRIVIMKEDIVDFPSNFKDLGYISFAKDQLEAKALDVLKELIGFGIVKVST